MDIRNFTFAFLTLVLASCATPRNSDTSVTSDYSSRLEGIEHSLSSLYADIEKQSAMVSDRLSNLKVNNTTVVYSPPDSTGKQYPVEVSTTEVNRENKQLTRMEENLSVDIDVLARKVDSLSNVVNSALMQKDKVVELSWWDRYKTEVFMSAVVIILVLQFLYRNKPFC